MQLRWYRKHYGLLWHANSLLSTLWEFKYNYDSPSLECSDFVSPSFFPSFSFPSSPSFPLLSPSSPFPLKVHYDVRKLKELISNMRENYFIN